MELGRKESDEQLEERINAQAPNKCCTLIYTVSKKRVFVMLCAIWYHLYNLKTLKTPMEEC